MNLSINTQVFTDAWKTGLVAPLFKEGNREERRFMNTCASQISSVIGNQDSERGTPEAAVYWIALMGSTIMWTLELPVGSSSWI